MPPRPKPPAKKPGNNKGNHKQQRQREDNKHNERKEEWRKVGENAGRLGENAANRGWKGLGKGRNLKHDPHAQRCFEAGDQFGDGHPDLAINPGVANPPGFMLELFDAWGKAEAEAAGGAEMDRYLAEMKARAKYRDG